MKKVLPMYALLRPLFSLALTLLFLSFSGCAGDKNVSPPLGPALSDVGMRQGYSTQSLELGLAIYQDSCTRCHSPMPIQRYSLQRWKEMILPDMARRAQLSDAQTADLSAYIVTAHHALTTPTLTPRQSPAQP